MSDIAVIIGLGYVGLPLACEATRSGLRVIGFDLNEDYFFSFYLTSYNPFFKIPSVKKALKFSFDENPDKAFALNNNLLPMACHGWPKYKKFWKNYIPEIPASTL